MKNVQQGCLANLLGMPPKSTTDGELKPSKLTSCSLGTGSTRSRQDSGEGSFLAYGRLPSCRVLMIVEKEREQGRELSGASSYEDANPILWALPSNLT